MLIFLLNCNFILLIFQIHDFFFLIFNCNIIYIFKIILIIWNKLTFIMFIARTKILIILILKNLF